MKMIDIITGKRNGNRHTFDEINFLIKGVTNGTIPDYQISAWLMATYFNGMDIDETSMLTDAMAKSGDILDLSRIGEFVVDKHSTGGVGDKTTLILIPLLAAAGIPVAKLSGRGLGHTGGTIDKLESIPGFKTSLELDEFLSQVKNIGAAIASQTAHLAPADGKLYALRDVTATIESIPLIAASVVSKKIAAGANVIVLDVKCGNGAFMKTLTEAQKLSNTMVEIGKRLNKSISAVITSMEQPLGKAVGNSLEVIESIQTLKNQGPDDLTELTLTLGAVSLIKLNMAKNIQDGKEILGRYLKDGSAYNKFKEIVKEQGGDIRAIENVDYLPAAKYKVEVKSDESGYISSLDALGIAKACKLLGAGREKKGDTVDYSVGIVLNKKVGDKAQKEEILAIIHANSRDLIAEAVNMVKKAYTFAETTPKELDLVYEIIM